MTVLGMLLALSTAVTVGYIAGHRAGFRRAAGPPQPRRVTPARRAVGMVVILAAGQLQRSAHRWVWGSTPRRTPAGNSRSGTVLNRIPQAAQRRAAEFVDSTLVPGYVRIRELRTRPDYPRSDRL